jgi:hypothetical protein
MARGDLITEEEAASRAKEASEERARAWAAFGYRLEEEEVGKEIPEFYLLPESIPIYRLWCDVQTQWRQSMNGDTGLDYSGVEAYMRMSQNPLRRSAETIHLLRVMESATLRVAAERRALALAKGSA